MAIFIVVRRRTERWNRALPLTEQEAWQAHADFMDGLAAESFALIVGPLDDTGEALLVARAESAEEIERRLDGDPWTELGLLETIRVSPWTVRIGADRLA